MNEKEFLSAMKESKMCWYVTELGSIRGRMRGNGATRCPIGGVAESKGRSVDGLGGLSGSSFLSHALQRDIMQAADHRRSYKDRTRRIRKAMLRLVKGRKNS